MIEPAMLLVIPMKAQAASALTPSPLAKELAASIYSSVYNPSPRSEILFSRAKNPRSHDLCKTAHTRPTQQKAQVRSGLSKERSGQQQEGNSFGRLLLVSRWRLDPSQWNPPSRSFRHRVSNILSILQSSTDFVLRFHRNLCEPVQKFTNFINR